MKTQKKIIGIISYLPNAEATRLYRKNKLDILLSQCNKLFDLPIIIIAQNYSDEDVLFFIKKYKNLFIYQYKDKLGITGARKELRKKFIDSDYDYLIMLDDDITLLGDSGQEYLKQIDDNPDCFIENHRSRLQLFAISKTIFKEHDFDDIEAERGEGFEDRIFFYTLCKKFPEAHKQFKNTGIDERALATKDPNSTWYKGQNLKEMLEKTNKKIEELA